MKKLNLKSSGSALLSALFIMTLVAIAATAMSTRLQYDIYRTRLLINKDQFHLASETVHFWAMHELKQKKLKFLHSQNGKKVALFPDRYQSLYPEFKLSGHLDDMQAKLNLNGLKDKETFSIALQLFQQLFPKMPEKQRQTLLLNIKDWISPYRPELGMDDLQAWYLQQTPAYQPARQAMKSLSELRLVKGISAAYYQKLEPYVTVLPEPTPINIRTAAEPILNSLSAVIEKNNIKKVIELRKGKDEKALLKFLKQIKLPEKSISIQSLYFKSEASVLHHGHQYHNAVIFKRVRNKKKNISVHFIRLS